MLDLLDEDINAGLWPTRAISLTQPWAYFMLSLPPEHRKRIENRSWNSAARGPVWVHASKKMTLDDFRSACDFARRAGVPLTLLPSSSASHLIPRGGIVGRFSITGVIRPGTSAQPGVPTPSGQERWYMGQYGYVVEDAAACPIVRCAGALGFWRVPHDVLRKLAEQESSR
jgi:hypothetical protein